MTRAVVTGASGFVGGHALRALKEQFDVVGVSRRAIEGRSLFRVADYGDTPAGDVLIHLAETNHRVQVEHRGEPYLHAAVEVLERLLAKRFSTVVYISSAAVYGDQSTTPHQPADPVRAGDVYTRTKLACESLVLASGGSVARLSNLIGPGMATDNVVSTVLGQLPEAGSVRVIDDTPVRDFLWIDDAVSALVRMACARASGVYNVGSGTGTSIRTLACMALSVAGQAHRQVVATRPAGRLSCIVLDISATTRDLAWVPATSLADGLARLWSGGQTAS